MQLMWGSHTMPAEARSCLGGETSGSFERDEGFDMLSEGNETVV